MIGHHSFPNVKGLDPDLYHAPSLIRHSDDIRHRPVHRFQTLTFLLTWLVGVPLSMLFNGVSQALNKTQYNRCVTFARSKHLNTDSLRFRLAFYTIVIHILPLILNGLNFKGLLFTLIPIYLFSLFFMISSQINHLTPDSTDKFSRNFFIHQILTSHNVSTDNYFVFLFTGGLNF